MRVRPSANAGHRVYGHVREFGKLIVRRAEVIAGCLCRVEVVGVLAEWKWWAVVGVPDKGMKHASATHCLNGICEQTRAHYIYTWRRHHFGLNMELNRNRRHKYATLTNASLDAMPVSGSDTIARLAKD
jgi:hypothetical protein